MINKISSMRIVPINFKAETANTKQTEKQNINTQNSLNTLSIYNSAAKQLYIKDEDFELTPYSMMSQSIEEISKIDGEKIYSSDGKLHSIVRRDENTITIYKPDNEDENTFQTIMVLDKSNRMIKSQLSYKDNDSVATIAREYNPETGKEIRYTHYIDSEPCYVARPEDESDSKTKSIEHDLQTGEYYIYLDDKDNELYKKAVFDEKKQLKEYGYRIEKDNYFNDTTMYFYNGTPYKIKKQQTMYIPNNIKAEFIINQEELKPAEYIKKSDNLKEIDGEKKYYSNGELEQIHFTSEDGDCFINFDPDGTCRSILSPKKEIYFYDDDNQTIIEYIDNKKKTTSYDKSDFDYVRIEDENSYKEIFYNNEDNKSITYAEGYIKNNEEHCTKSFEFNKDGILISE